MPIPLSSACQLSVQSEISGKHIKSRLRSVQQEPTPEQKAFKAMLEQLEKHKALDMIGDYQASVQKAWLSVPNSTRAWTEGHPIELVCSVSSIGALRQFKVVKSSDWEAVDTSVLKMVANCFPYNFGLGAVTVLKIRFSGNQATVEYIDFDQDEGPKLMSQMSLSTRHFDNFARC